EPRPGIPQARNACLEKCRQLHADWIAFTDDDCWVSPAWLVGLLDAAARHRADVVYGRREFLFPLPLPFWVGRPEESLLEEGQSLSVAPTQNVLSRRWLVRKLAGPGLTSDGALPRGGNAAFSSRATQPGAGIVYPRGPGLVDTVPRDGARINFGTR